MGEEAVLTLAAKLTSLSRFRAFIDRACSKVHIDEETCYDIKLATDEACSNIIEHGYAGVEPGSIVLALQYKTGQFVVRITDYGHSIEPAEPPLPHPADAFRGSKPGGFGLFLIYRSMDLICYETGANGNTLTMVKILDKQKQENELDLPC